MIFFPLFFFLRCKLFIFSLPVMFVYCTDPAVRDRTGTFTDIVHVPGSFSLPRGKKGR